MLSGAVGPFEPSAWEEEATEVVQATDIGGFFGERFRVDARLGVGAMGRVLTAVDTKTNTLVALKVLHKDRAKNPEIVERFQREAAVLRQIRHPAIVRLVAFDRARDGTWWLAMEHLQGETLKDRIQQGGPFTPAAAWPVLATICDGVAVAHAQGILHRDLKPENVLLLASGLPPCKILDFGLSRYTTKPDRITATGAVLGTPRYMAPELLAEASYVDERVDVFAIGVIAFEMLTGRSIYPADDFAQLIGCILDGRTIPLRKIRPDASPELERVIAAAVAKDAAQRIPTADALANALAAALRVSPDRRAFLPAPDSAHGLREARHQPAASAVVPVDTAAASPGLVAPVAPDAMGPSLAPNRPAAPTVLVGSGQSRVVHGGAPAAASMPPVVPSTHKPASTLHVPSRQPGASSPSTGTLRPTPSPGAVPPQAPIDRHSFPAPTPQSFAPTPQGFAPTPQGFAPTPQSFAPTPQTVSSAPSSGAQTFEGPFQNESRTGPLQVGFPLAAPPPPSRPAGFTQPIPAARVPMPTTGEGPSPRSVALWVGLFLVAAVVTMAGAGALAYLLRTWLASR
ncbi:MAG: hypothetical protein OHK0013_50090 [Sandaracinaceae bacterium]